jgi:hypothetical protein
LNRGSSWDYTFFCGDPYYRNPLAIKKVYQDDRYEYGFEK